jgi:1-acyl-sn-glycerol-3-phosphate acyltransferase
MLYKLLKPIAAFLFKLFFKIEVKGKEKFPSSGPFILASNHLSYLDPIVLGIGCPHRLYFFAKEELFDKKIVSFFLKRLGAIPLKRDRVDTKVIRAGINLLREKKKPLVIFPQGTRSNNYERFMPGASFLFKKTGVPLIIAKVYGTDRVLPRDAKFVRPGKIKVIFDRIPDLKRTESIQEITFKIKEKIKNL